MPLVSEEVVVMVVVPVKEVVITGKVVPVRKVVTMAEVVSMGVDCYQDYVTIKQWLTYFLVQSKQ
jgi:hypothetical protein